MLSPMAATDAGSARGRWQAVAAPTVASMTVATSFQFIGRILLRRMIPRGRSPPRETPRPRLRSRRLWLLGPLPDLPEGGEDRSGLRGPLPPRGLGPRRPRGRDVGPRRDASGLRRAASPSRAARARRQHGAHRDQLARVHLL